MLTVYTTDSCAYCPTVEKFLNFKKLPYKKINVTDDMDARKELFELTGLSSVPVITDGKQFVVGWNPSQLLTKFAA